MLEAKIKYTDCDFSYSVFDSISKEAKDLI